MTQQLTRRFSPLTMLLLSINGMIGSAWLFAPLYAAKIAGSTALIAWLIGGAITIVVALTFAELSTLLPVAGGTTRLPQLSHGALTSFMMSWVAWLSCVTMPPIEVQATLQYASTYFPTLTHLVNGTPELTGIGLLWAAILMGFLCCVNIGSFKGLVRFNLGLFLFKIAVIVLTIGMLIKTSFHPTNFTIGAYSFSDAGHHWQAILAAVATGGIAFAFTGFKHSVELAGETKNSQLAIPLAIIGSVVGCLILYIGLQVAFIGALNPASLIGGWANLSFAQEAGPFVGIAGILGLAWLVKLLYVDAAVSPLGAGFVYTTSTARIIYAMGQNGYLSSRFARLNKNNFPAWAIGLNFIVGMFLFLPLPGWQNMVSFLVSAVVIAYAMGPIALVCLREQLPNQKRPFRLPAAKTICLLAFYFCNLMCFWTGWNTMSKLAIALVIGFILFIAAYLRGSIDKTRAGLKAVLWIAPYLAGLTIISYLGSYGNGLNVLPFGWDFLVIAIFSAAIFYLAIITRLGRVPQQQDSSMVAEDYLLMTKHQLPSIV
jgi:amino acid transporter